MSFSEREQLNEVVYVAADFPSIFDRLVRRLQSQLTDDEYAEFVSSPTGEIIIDLMAYAAAQLSWAMNRRASESFLSTARTSEAVARAAEQSGYKMRPSAPASGSVTLTFSEPLGASGTVFPLQVFGASGLTFEALAAVDLTLGMTSVDVPVREGETRTLSFVSDGTANQEYRISSLREGEYLSSGSVSVSIDGDDWSESVFLTFDRTNQFQVGYAGEPPWIRFGDGNMGNIPPKDATISVSYFANNGEAGNVASGRVSVAGTAIVVGGEPVSYTVTNANGMSGGAEPETIAEAKANAPMYYAARESAIIATDYIALVNSFTDPEYGSVAKGWAVCVRNGEIDPITAGFLSSIGVSAASVGTVSSDVLGAVDAAVAAYNEAASAVDVVLASASASVGIVDGHAEDVEVLGGQLLSYAATATAAASSLSSTVLEAATYVASISDEGVRGALSSYLAQITAHADALSSPLSSISASSGQVVESSERARSELASVVVQIAQVSDGVKAGSESVTLASGCVSSAKATLDGDVLAVQTLAVSIREHVASMFDSDCGANVVTVPVLTRGANGHYVAPNEGLMRRLQEELDRKCGITHQPLVVSGAGSLLSADVEIAYRLADGAVPAVVVAAILSVVNTHIRSLTFSQRLNESTLYRLIEKIGGIAYFNVRISAPVDRLDEDGNLVPTGTEIVTAGSITTRVLP